jgi:hypothetical protein
VLSLVVMLSRIQFTSCLQSYCYFLTLPYFQFAADLLFLFVWHSIAWTYSQLWPIKSQLCRFCSVSLFITSQACLLKHKLVLAVTLRRFAVTTSYCHVLFLQTWSYFVRFVADYFGSFYEKGFESYYWMRLKMLIKLSDIFSPFCLARSQNFESNF